jgi:Tc toxin complex TcA C-terminal TcB-binding domain/Neuraminidase-like domain
LQRVQALTPKAEAIPVLLNAGINTALQVSAMPQKKFTDAFKDTLGQDTALQIHDHAMKISLRNEQALTHLHQTIKGTGFAAIDGENLEHRIQIFQKVAKEYAVNINLEELFGDVDFCECDNCNSLTSPAAYFVDLLQYLRSNNLDPSIDAESGTPKFPNTRVTGYGGTALEKLFRRRPDLQHLELTCENTNTLIPYVDLVNEVMESFVVHEESYARHWSLEKQVEIDSWNVSDETSNELLAEAQHTNYQAYCVLRQAVYPLGKLPYHQPIDAIRIYLKFLKTSRYEVLDIFRKPFSAPTTVPPGQIAEMSQLHNETLDRSVKAEYLSIIQEEYIILTKEAFWPKLYFEITANTKLSTEAYQKQIGVRQPHDYWGYKTNAQMLSDDETQAIGLSFVKNQFLKRSGMTYAEIVELVKTNYVNPLYPAGRALAMLHSIRFSYRFLQTLVDYTADTVRDKFHHLIEFLVVAQPWVDMYEIYTRVEKQDIDCKPSLSRKDICQWVYQWFECLGKLVVLESGEGPTLPIHGDLRYVVQKEDPETPKEEEPPVVKLLATGASVGAPETGTTAIEATILGSLKEDGRIFNAQRRLIAIVAIDSRVFTLDGDLLANKYKAGELQIWMQNQSPTHANLPIAIINRQGYLQWRSIRGQSPGVVRWNAVVDTCNIDKVRLLHLDGSNLCLEEWDRMHRFIRLWRRLGWTVDETDKALWGLSATPSNSPDCPSDGTSDSVVDFDDFAPEDCRASQEICNKQKSCDCSGDCTCSSEPIPPGVCQAVTIPDITPDFLKQLVSVKKLLELTGLEVIKLLALWAPISTSGEKSLYSRLFLTHNLLGVDEVFKADADGNYLSTSTRILDHVPVILAAFRLKRDDLTMILKETGLNDADLTLNSTSRIYRYALISQSLRIKVPVLFQAIRLFGSPFANANSALDFLSLYNPMIDQGFTIQQLSYAIEGADDPLKPLGPSKVDILKTTKALFDGLNAIDAAHPDLKDSEKETVTTETVTKNISLLYDQSIVAQINSLLEGTTSFVTNAPISLNVNMPDFLKAKLNYFDPVDAVTNRRAKLTVVGILTDGESAAAKELVSSPNWAAAIDRLKKQALSFFKNALSEIFPNTEEAITKLLAGDVIVPDDKLDPNQPNPNTAPGKRLYFLQFFLPYLRDQLADQLVASTMAGEAGISTLEITMLLLRKILTGSGDKSALDILKGLKVAPSSSSSSWTGYLIPSTTDSYTFVGYGDTKPTPLVIDGEPISFPFQQGDPTDVWFTEPRTLTGGRLYYISVDRQPVPGLGWMTPRTTVVQIPSTALLPDYSTNAATEVFVKLTKSAIIINGFGLSIDDIDYVQSHAPDFADFDLNNMKVQAWKRTLAFVNFRGSLTAQEYSLLDLFKWASTLSTSPTLNDIANQIIKATGWSLSSVLALLGPTALSLGDPTLFRNEVALVELQKALNVVDKVGVDILSLFKWANPMAKFWPSREIAEEIRKSIRSRYSLDDWEQAVKPLHDELRMHERDALIAYLVVHQELIEWGVVDTDSLFEFFLIDVQMGACLKTSRMKQAISSVQLFVQRCMLGLEDKYGVENDALDQSRWAALSKETIRTANVKVLLTPENYIVSSLRDDKSPLYDTLENEILQKDINPQALKESLTSYLYGLDQVANLRVEGLFQDNDENETVYIVGKSRSTPYTFYNRTYQKIPRFWTPWRVVPVDIPTYQIDATANTASYDGSYVLPVIWQNRFLIFFGELAKKTIARDLGSSNLSSATPDQLKPYETWDIKLGWSELRNGKWTQKKTTIDSVMEAATASVAPPLDAYRFVSRVMGTSPTTWISIDVYKNGSSDPIGRFEFKGSQAYAAPIEATPTKLVWSESTSFHFTGRSSTTGDPFVMYCFQNKAFQPNAAGDPSVRTFPHASYPRDAMSTSSITIRGSTIPFNHTFSHQILSTINTSLDLNPVLETFRSISDLGGQIEAFGYAGHEPAADGQLHPTYNELVKPYSLYNWEIGFHAPMQLADALLQNQQFDAALAMCHYVFDPYADGLTKQRVWKWKPFSLVSSENVLEALFNSLQPNKPDKTNGQITQWRENPFMPHVVARTRPVAYMKWTVMKYLQILIAYGDYYFRQNTLEAVPLAIQCYILASHIYGPAGQRIPKRGKVKPQTYYSLLDKWDAVSNAVVDLELSFPFSNQIPHPFQFRGEELALANIFGFATARYFCIPDNPQSRALRDLIDDRLYKIRHCQDINGNPISLALWEPPLDPSLLVNAVAQGLSLSSFLNDLNAPMPNYRFYYLLQKALELCSELRSMGDRFLGLKEKRDALALDLLRSTHENNMHRLVMEVRKLQVDEANRTIESLRISRNGPHYRYKLYSSMAGFDMPDLVETDTSYTPIPLNITKPTTEGDLVITTTEKNEMDEAKLARDRNIEIAEIEIFNAFMESLPGVSISIEPWGIGGSLSFGPQNIAANLSAFARYIRVLADEHTFNSTNSARKAGYIKQQQERVQLANSAAFEVKNIDAQITVQRTRVAMAGQEITNQQQQIDNSAEIIDFLKGKYTNDELYSWMENSLRTLFYQTYTLAYDIAKKAESAFIFERGPQPSPFIRFGYWDSGRDGLQSGEQLYLALKQMESAYQERRGHDFEITKAISIRQLNPLALLELRENASCKVDLPEILFDMDFPGHYFRRIKSVALTIPCVVGPYTGINCSLRLLGHRYRHVPTAPDSKSYLEQTEEGPDPRFKTGAIPVGSIAVSTGQNDSGVFELSFKDERYIPFEGAGVISQWQIDLPHTFRQFDYSSINDVIMTVRYISMGGGEKLKKVATEAVGEFLKPANKGGGFLAFFDLKSEFATEWARASMPPVPSQPPSPPSPRIMALKNLPHRLPFFTKTTDPKKIIARDVSLLTATDLPGSTYSLTTDATGATSDPITFGGGASSEVGKLKMFTQSEVDAVIGDWSLSITVTDPKVVMDRIFLLVRYTLG